ncbi:MAG: PDDEXK nuclease domain-containing protein [Betaproteobacteria bacterium]|nr:PDDEXK nuclease domain-containing protein [Betaproteobacteria bacterium]
MNFNALVQTIADIHQRAHAGASKAINAALTLRNWLIGAHIHEYELQGQDRATYGDRLIGKLSGSLQELGVPSCERVRLYSYLNFYRAYPQISETISSETSSTGFDYRQFPIVRSLTEQSLENPYDEKNFLPGKLLLARLSFTHLELLSSIEDPLKKAFYELECIKGNWSVRELKRQIGSLYFERSGLSRDPAQLSALANAAMVQTDPAHIIRDPYVFEFLGFRPSEVLPESGLEAALIEKMQGFLLELGRGFCFEARQKRLNIGGEYFFVDLVFYHRILKCHVLVELKVGAFSHEQLGQLNTYITYYRTHEMAEGDQPPIGILLCTGKNQALVEYALAGMDNRLFVSRYQLELPETDILRRYLDEQRQTLEAGTPGTPE